MTTLLNTRWRGRWAAFTGVLALAVVASQCSSGSLPGSPSPVGSVGGAARYRGTLTYTRLAGGFLVEPPRQQLDLSMVLGGSDQLTGRFESNGSTGSLQGVVQGTLGAGTFTATLLISTQASGPGGGSVCEGVGQVNGQFSGRDVTWNASNVTYDNCPGLVVRSDANAEAFSPVPGTYGTRANVVVSVTPSTSVARGTCPSGSPGWAFTVIASETGGIDVQLDDTFTVEERTPAGTPSRSAVDTPFASLTGGGQRNYAVCSPAAGTYQAFFSGSDARGNRIRFATPVINLLP